MMMKLNYLFIITMYYIMIIMMIIMIIMYIYLIIMKILTYCIIVLCFNRSMMGIMTLFLLQKKINC